MSPEEIKKKGGEIMSMVTNVLLSYDLLENDKVLGQVNSFFKDSKPLVSCDDHFAAPIGWYGGTKMLEVNLAIGAFNYFIENDFLNHLRTIKWESPECVQLILKEQDDDQFRIIQMVGP